MLGRVRGPCEVREEGRSGADATYGTPAMERPRGPGTTAPSRRATHYPLARVRVRRGSRCPSPPRRTCPRSASPVSTGSTRGRLPRAARESRPFRRGPTPHLAPRLRRSRAAMTGPQSVCDPTTTRSSPDDAPARFGPPDVHSPTYTRIAPTTRSTRGTLPHGRLTESSE